MTQGALFSGSAERRGLLKAGVRVPLYGVGARENIIYSERAVVFPLGRTSGMGVGVAAVRCAAIR